MITIEEKAKAYDEALGRAKQIRNGNPSSGTAIVVCEQIFPELRESEDEMIRRTLVEYFGPEVQLDFVRGVPIQKIRDWLEKQKENPKTADSIPADCASNAKCEDRWHKVNDSLPEDTREVICKDAIGNYFIGRYYKCSDSWEVMMYDDCDKSNEDNPPVVMWVDIPSEKQKEQKPAWSEEDEHKKQVLTLEGEFDGYNSIVVTLDKYVLEGIGVYRHDKVIIQIQRKED